MRYDMNEQRTIGRLSIDGLFQCYTLEDCVRSGPKVPGQTAIPAGRYEVIVNQSVRFRRNLPLLLNVPGFSGVRIHAGNDAGDTEGCVLLGMKRDVDSVLDSRVALEMVQGKIQAAIAAKEPVWMEIENVRPVMT